MVRVERLAARVTLEDPCAALARAEAAAADGDESWSRWVEEYRRGEAVIVRVDTTLEASAGEGGPLVIHVANHGVFLEKDPQPPNVEQQVGELAAKDFSMLARELAERGHRVDRHVLGQMYVHVELGQDVRDSLSDAGSRSRGSRGGLPDFEAGVSKPDGPRAI